LFNVNPTRVAFRCRPAFEMVAGLHIYGLLIYCFILLHCWITIF